MPGWMHSICSQKFLTSVRDASSKDVWSMVGWRSLWYSTSRSRMGLDCGR